MILGAVSISSCAPPHQPEVPQPVEHHGHVAELPVTAGAGFTTADVRFMQHMIGHHAQALRMTQIARYAGASHSVLTLAQKIDISQRDEIGMMQEWLAERKQVVPADTQSHAMLMPGMLTTEQMSELSAARGRKFDVMFLTFMIQHHRGALQMVEELFKTPGAGQDPDIFRFATDVKADQRDEIFVMERLLDNIR